MLRRILLAAAIATAVIAPATPAYADKPPVYTALLSNVGVNGHDVVAYFTAGQPTRGATQFKTVHNGVEYRFASAANLAAFRASPARYLPQYGGYCAWAVAQGYTASADPTNWRIVDGRLYLNYNDEIQRRWEGDIAGHIRSANANWPDVLSR